MRKYDPQLEDEVRTMWHDRGVANLGTDIVAPPFRLASCPFVLRGCSTILPASSQVTRVYSCLRLRYAAWTILMATPPLPGCPVQ